MAGVATENETRHQEQLVAVWVRVTLPLLGPAGGLVGWSACDGGARGARDLWRCDSL